MAPQRDVNAVIKHVEHLAKEYDKLPEGIEWGEVMWNLMYTVHCLVDDYCGRMCGLCKKRSFGGVQGDPPIYYICKDCNEDG